MNTNNKANPSGVNNSVTNGNHVGNSGNNTTFKQNKTLLNEFYPNNVETLMKQIGISNTFLTPELMAIFANLSRLQQNFQLPAAPKQVTKPVFGEDSMSAIATLYKNYFDVNMRKIEASGADPEMIKLLRFFGFIQLILIRALSMMDVYSLLRMKYVQNDLYKIVRKIEMITKNISDKTVEGTLYRTQLQNLKDIIITMASGRFSPVLSVTDSLKNNKSSTQKSNNVSVSQSNPTTNMSGGKRKKHKRSGKRVGKKVGKKHSTKK